MNGWAWVDLETATERRVICERPKGSNPDEEGITISALTFGEEDIELNCYSDSDIDGDGLLDYQELSSLDLGSFDETTGAYTHATVGDYCDIAETKGVCVSKGVRNDIKNLRLSSYRSDVHLADKDSDAFTDNEDAVPFKGNEDLIEILCLGTDQKCIDDANALKTNYTVNYGKNCEILYFDGYESFIAKWSSIGNPEKMVALPHSPFSYEFFLNDYMDLYYYSITDVVLLSHGNTNAGIPGFSMNLSSDEYLCPEHSSEVEASLRNDYSNYFFIEDISVCRNFESLDMMVCDAATKLYPEIIKKNLAETFISHFSSIQNVYAFDCACDLSYQYDSGKVAWVAELHHSFDYNPLDTFKHKSISDTTNRNDFILAVEENFPDQYAGFNGQVLYFRIMPEGKYYEDDDLYDGNIDISYYWEYKDYFDPNVVIPVITGAEDKRFKNIGYPEIFAQVNYYFDPVLENNT